MSKESFIFLGATDEQVRWGNCKDPRLYFSKGDILHLEKEEVHTWHTKFFFKEVPGVPFNSVCFQTFKS
jgi:hypothetical protein